MEVTQEEAVKEEAVKEENTKEEAAGKEEKHPDNLAAYNKKIIDSYWELAGGEQQVE